ncbi:hypothetical protein E2C01_015413 [Portunus trituberculatus]|uniref:Uncharacterized protein n=1 Tax=Portunus trituberculatus TaxID=210409 RepID=A0A5B7DLT1_PORTR|nr:hypothetical protein [Portunus trituberculatus]
MGVGSGSAGMIVTSAEYRVCCCRWTRPKSPWMARTWTHSGVGFVGSLSGWCDGRKVSICGHIAVCMWARSCCCGAAHDPDPDPRCPETRRRSRWSHYPPARDCYASNPRGRKRTVTGAQCWPWWRSGRSSRQALTPLRGAKQSREGVLVTLPEIFPALGGRMSPSLRFLYVERRQRRRTTNN